MTKSERHSSDQSVTMPRAFMPMTSTRLSLLARSQRPQTRCTSSACTAMITIATGAALARKALKPRPACEPIRMLGGSPISVAVPPTLEAKTSANKNGKGGSSSSSAMTSVTGTIKSTVETLLSTAESIAVASWSISKMPAGLARTRCTDQMARYWKSPERREIETRIIMPARRPIVFQSIPLMASS